MVLENLCVLHKAFGHGVVTEVKGKYMVIKFRDVQKTFVYPDAFESFLTCADGSVPSAILEDLSRTKQQKQQIEEAKNAENRHAMTHGIVIPGKEINLDNKEDEGSQSTTEDI